MFVVGRITQVALPLRADSKINRDRRARLVSSNRDSYYTNITHILYMYTRGGLNWKIQLVIVLTKSAPASILSYLLREEERKIFSVSINE